MAAASSPASAPSDPSPAPAIGPAPAPALAPGPAPAAPPPPIRDECMHKNRLQELAARTVKKLPVYHSEIKGEHPQLQFRSTVQVGSEQFSSTRYHSRLKDAEQDAAKVAYEIMSRINDDDFKDVLGMIEQDVMFSKSILHDFSVKTKADMPCYTTVQLKGLGTMPLFISSVMFAGNTYSGEAAKCKKDAEQKAARAAIKSILATNNVCMLQIIRSKKRLITAITSSGYNKERGAVSQENQNAPARMLREKNAPANALPQFTAIKFVRAVGSSDPTTDQGINIGPTTDPSAQVSPDSNKWKKKKIT